jgi:hypothetical protein
MGNGIKKGATIYPFGEVFGGFDSESKLDKETLEHLKKKHPASFEGEAAKGEAAKGEAAKGEAAKK